MPEAQKKPKPTVLLLDDDPLIAMDLEVQLIERGFNVCGPCHNAKDALGYIETTQIDFAILDFNLKRGRTSSAVAEKLLAEKIPFCFLSGYSSTQVLEMAGFDQVPCLSKPINQTELSDTLNRIS